MSKRLLSSLLALLCLALAGSAEDIDTQTGCFSGSFKTLQIKVNSSDQLPAVIALATPDFLEISFDELADARRYLRARLLHCSMDWRPDNIPDQMFIDGFNETAIENHEFSQATNINYVHYSLTIPNPDMRIKASGNYLLQVYDESDPSKVLLQARFVVSENSADIVASFTPRTDIDYQRAHQQLSVTAEPKLIDVQDPYRDLRLVISQNGRIDNVATVAAPMRINGAKLIYEHTPALIFEAGNEYRRFETVTINYPGMGVDEMSFRWPYYHATLRTDLPRSSSDYVYDETQQGRFRIRTSDSAFPESEANYALVHFSLEMPELHGRKVYIDGDLTNRRFDSSSLMTYNRERGCYEATLLLKQGSYNYRYLVVNDGTTRASAGPIEGNRYQTVNEYVILLYYRNPGELFDRVIGHRYFLSIP